MAGTYLQLMFSPFTQSGSKKMSLMCAQCQRNTRPATRIECRTAPAVLVQHIAAFGAFNLNRMAAHRLQYTFDLQASQRFDWLNHRYSLSAFILHSGQINRGHYIACVRRGDIWWRCDDSTVQPFRFGDSIAPNWIVFMTFYERE